MEIGPRSNARGLTLVELMISMVIGMMVIGVMGVLFAANGRTRSEIERAAQQVENGRLAMELLRDDIHQAGFYGGLTGISMQVASACVPRSGVTLDAASLGWQQVPAMIPMPIHGYAAGDTPATDSCLSNQKVNTDALIVRRVDSDAISVAAAGGASFANDLYLQVSNCANPLIDSAAMPFVVAAGGAGTPARFPLRERDCATPAPLRRLVVRAYYIGRCSVCSGSGDAIPSLRMVELSGSTATSASIVEGIESLRIEYAFDTAGNGRIDSVRRCAAAADPCSATDWTRIAAVQVYLLARSLTASPGYTDTKSYAMGLAGTLPPFNDKFKRRLYSSLFVARNPAGPREQ